MPHAIRRISDAKIVIFFQTAMTQRNNFAPDNPLQEKTSTRPIGFIQSHEGGCCGYCIWTVLLPLWDVAQGFEMRSGGGCFCEACLLADPGGRGWTEARCGVPTCSP